eukprot:GHVP01014717.1.p1 GENE.GHVP01014717.1~~GHVP01014717.1.p1  ORF type:complete len:580 (+),score=84.71 GHVP01014717.1:1188-2927(+)
MKFLFVTGGTLSGLGKGTTVSCIGAVLRAYGYKVTCIKIDPYLNVDAGTMSPYEHGEVYVLSDGAEVDLDLGNYERFLGLHLNKDHNITTGKIFEKILKKERRGDFLGKTVQFVPQLTDTIKDWIKNLAQREHEKRGIQICLVEVGGTVGDIESAYFLEAIQQLKQEIEEHDFLHFHLTYIPELGPDKEQKTKPMQHSIKELRAAGLQPDIIGCRCDHEIRQSVRDKVSLYSQVKKHAVISLHTTSNIYCVPKVLESQDILSLVAKKLDLPPPNALESDMIYSMSFWERLSRRNYDHKNKTIKIGITGKYTGLADSYLSVIKALKHSALHVGCNLEIEWIESTNLETSADDPSWTIMRQVDGIVCPGGFGDRGISGKANASKFCRENLIPYLGICLGMQTAIIDVARNVLGYEDANSTEFDPKTKYPVVGTMEDFANEEKGGTMRLGDYETYITDKNSLCYKLYDNKDVVVERHRHRYEINHKYVPEITKTGLLFVGQDKSGTRMEFAEMKDHPYFVCSQYHPEFTSRPGRPNPMFLGLLLCAAGYKKNGSKGCREFLDKRFERFDNKLNCEVEEDLDW